MASQRWALLIGADIYLKGDARKDENGRVIHYPNLGGCSNDVALVECFLKTEVGVTSDHITKLTSSGENSVDQSKPQEDPSAWPTYKNIARAFQNILQKCAKGDSVYIHYSGHGARARTVYPRLKGPKGLDEALVPMDIEVLSETDQGQYVRDIELATWLQGFVDKDIHLVLTLDSCHSGSANRAGGVNTRGISEVDYSVLKTDCPADPDQPQSYLLGDSRQGRVQKNWLLEASGYTLFAACTAFQKAHEHWFDGTKYGVLTYYLIGALRSRGFIQPSLLLRTVSAMVQSQFSTQTPVVDGRDVTFLGTIEPRRALDVTVVGVDDAKQCIDLDHGNLHGIQKGDVYEIISAADNGVDPVLISRAEVTVVNGLKSVAKLSGPGAAAQGMLKPGCRAVLVKQAPGKPTAVGLLVRGTVPSPADQAKLLQGFRDYLGLGGKPPLLWELSADNAKDSAEIFVAVAGDRYEVLDTSHTPFPNLPPIQVDNSSAFETLSGYITHLVKFRLVQRLSADQFSSMTLPSLFEITGKSTEPPTNISQNVKLNFSIELEWPKPLEPVIEEGGVVTVQHNDIISIVFENKAKHAVYFSIFDLQPTWGIVKIFPENASCNDPVEPGQKRNLAIQLEIPDDILSRGVSEITDTLKAIVTVEETPLEVLELPAITAAPTRGRVAEDEFVSRLDQLLKDLSSSRNARVRRVPTKNSWEAHNIVVKTVNG